MCPHTVVPAQGDLCTTVIPAKAGIQGAVGELGLRRFGSPTLLCSGSYARVSAGGNPSPVGLGSREPNYSSYCFSLLGYAKISQDRNPSPAVRTTSPVQSLTRRKYPRPPACRPEAPPRDLGWGRRRPWQEAGIRCPEPSQKSSWKWQSWRSRSGSACHSPAMPTSEC